MLKFSTTEGDPFKDTSFRKTKAGDVRQLPRLDITVWTFIHS